MSFPPFKPPPPIPILNCVRNEETPFFCGGIQDFILIL